MASVPLQPGPYIIRYIPPAVETPLVGGLYADAVEVGEPLKARPAAPGISPTVWEVCLNDNNKYTITVPGFKSKLDGIGPILPGWSFSTSAHPEDPAGTILLGFQYIEFELEPTKSPHVFGINVPHKGPPSFQFYVAVNDSNDDIVSKLYFFSGIPPRPHHPHWEFITPPPQ